MKYIDIERLKAKIERRQEERQDRRDSASWENEYWPESEFSTRDDEDDTILSIIDSLQQEQPKFNIGDLVVSKKNPHLTYKILATNIPNELGKTDYKVEIFTDGKSGLLNESHNIHLISSGKIEDFGELVQQDQSETNMKSPFTGGKVAILSREEEVTFRGEKIKVIRKYYRCEDTGREFTNGKLDDDMMWTVFRTYCEKKGITSFTDIMLKQEQPEVDLEKEANKC